MSKNDKVLIGFLILVGVYILTRAIQNPIKRDEK